MSSQFGSDHFREFENGSCIFREGDSSREMFVIQEGIVEIRKKTNDGSEFLLATFTRGDFFGEMSLLESLPRSAGAYAIGKTRLLTIAPGGFLLKIRRDPTFAFEIMQALSRRIRQTNELALSGIQDNAKVECFERLRKIAEKSVA